MSSSYFVPTSDKSLSSVKSTVLATGVAFLFVYLVRDVLTQCHYAFHAIVTFVIDMEDKDRNKVKQKLLETSRVLYLYIICSSYGSMQRWCRFILPSTMVLTVQLWPG